jgi:hypothetical protein
LRPERWTRSEYAASLRPNSGHDTKIDRRHHCYGEAGASCVAAGGLTVLLLFVVLVVVPPDPGPRAKYQTATSRTTTAMIPRIIPLDERPPLSTTTVS